MTTNKMPWDYVLRFIIIGDASVGKSSLLIRLTDQRFLANPDPTLGLEIGSQLIYIEEEDKTVKLQCWDIAGTESFRSITQSYYRGACGALVVYDITSRKSFENARGWLADVRKYTGPNLTCILVGNKADLCDPKENANTEANHHNLSRRKRREVPREVAEQWAKEENLLFIETSAKSGDNVDQAFLEVSKSVVNKIKNGVFNNWRSRLARCQTSGPDDFRDIGARFALTGQKRNLRHHNPLTQKNRS